MSDESLRAAARGATPGPWDADDTRWGVVATEERICSTGNTRNASYIAAASPDVVLDLLDRLARAEGAVARCAALAERWGGEFADRLIRSNSTPKMTYRAVIDDLWVALNLGEVAGNVAEACVEASRSDEQGSGGVVGRAGTGAGS